MPCILQPEIVVEIRLKLGRNEPGLGEQMGRPFAQKGKIPLRLLKGLINSN
jgi:hypothetical protein